MVILGYYMHEMAERAWEMQMVSVSNGRRDREMRIRITVKISFFHFIYLLDFSVLIYMLCLCKLWFVFMTCFSCSLYYTVYTKRPVRTLLRGLGWARKVLSDNFDQGMVTLLLTLLLLDYVEIMTQPPPLFSVCNFGNTSFGRMPLC